MFSNWSNKFQKWANNIKRYKERKINDENISSTFQYRETCISSKGFSEK